MLPLIIPVIIAGGAGAALFVRHQYSKSNDAFRQALNDNLIEYLCYVLTNLLIFCIPYKLLSAGLIIDESHYILYTALLCIEIWWIKNCIKYSIGILFLWYKSGFSKNIDALFPVLEHLMENKNFLIKFLLKFSLKVPLENKEIKVKLLFFFGHIFISFTLYSLLFHYAITPFLEGGSSLPFPISTIKPFLQAAEKLSPVIMQNPHGCFTALFFFLIFTIITYIILNLLEMPSKGKLNFFSKFFTSAVVLGCFIPWCIARYFEALTPPLLLCIFCFAVIKYILWGLECVLEKE